MTSQSTQHYNLGKFIQTDIPSWLTDVNGNMDKLDNALYVLSQAQQTLQGELDTAISDLETAQGNISSLTEHSAVQDSSISSLQATVTNLTNSITSINTTIATINTFITETEPIIYNNTTNPSMFSNVSYGSVQASKKSGLISLSFNFAFNGTSNTGIEYLLFNALPVGMRPKYNTTIYRPTSSNVNVKIVLMATGEIKVQVLEPTGSTYLTETIILF